MLASSTLAAGTAFALVTGVQGADLGMRVTIVERGVDGLSGKVDRLQGDLTDLRSEVTDIRSDLTDLRSEVTDIRSDLTGLRSEMTDLRSDLTTFRSETTAEIAALRLEIRAGDEETRVQMRALHEDVLDRIASLRIELQHEIRAGDEATRAEMRVLHEDVVSRIALLQEGINGRRKSGRRRNGSGLLGIEGSLNPHGCS